MWWFNHHARRFFRMVMKPIDPVLAKKWHTRMRIFYVSSGFLAASFAFFTFKSHQHEINIFADNDPTKLHRIARLRGEPGKVIINRVGWGTKERYEFQNEKYIEEFNEQKKEKLKTAGVELPS